MAVGTSPVPDAVDVSLSGPMPPPAGTAVGGASGTTSAGLPILIVGRPFSVTRSDCDGGAGTVQVARNGVTRQSQQNGVTVSQATMTESPAGTYTATNRAVPFTGPAEGSRARRRLPRVAFNIYIDPSGFVRTTTGAPLPGATVTLFRSDDPGGPFAQVPDGSAVMSPSNATNPDLLLQLSCGRRRLGDAGAMLDGVAKAAYRRRIEELQAEVDDALEAGDDERAAQADVEGDALVAELSRAVGLGGRDRRAASVTERHG